MTIIRLDRRPDTTAGRQHALDHDARLRLFASEVLIARLLELDLAGVRALFAELMPLVDVPAMLKVIGEQQ